MNLTPIQRLRAVITTLAEHLDMLLLPPPQIPPGALLGGFGDVDIAQAEPIHDPLVCATCGFDPITCSHASALPDGHRVVVAETGHPHTPHPGVAGQTAGGSGEKLSGTGPTRTCTLQALIADTYACGALAARDALRPRYPLCDNLGHYYAALEAFGERGIYECVYCGQAAPDPSAAHGVGGGTPGSATTGSGPAPNHP